MRFMMQVMLVVMAGAGPRIESLEAGEHPDFSGTWEMDMDASEPLEPMLEAQGASWMERKLADRVSVTQHITQTDKQLIIKVDSTLVSRTEVLTLDGSVQVRKTDRMNEVRSRAYWDEDGAAIVTVASFAMPDGHKAEWTTRRYLADGGRTIVVDHLLEIDDGRRFTSKRLLRKK